MDIEDIKQFRRWHLDAAIRARKADFDIIYAYATHGYLLDQFLNDELNRSNSPYGSASGGAKLLVELLEDMREGLAIAARSHCE